MFAKIPGRVNSSWATIILDFIFVAFLLTSFSKICMGVPMSSPFLCFKSNLFFYINFYGILLCFLFCFVIKK
jgi:hypothetical protein